MNYYCVPLSNSTFVKRRTVIQLRHTINTKYYFQSKNFSLLDVVLLCKLR